MTKDERIAALREALLVVENVGAALSPALVRMVRDVIAADDLAAAEPLPDLPLAEGSRWCKWGDCDAVMAYETGRKASIDNGGVYIGNASAPLLDVLALARRAGAV